MGFSDTKAWATRRRGPKATANVVAAILDAKKCKIMCIIVFTLRSYVLE